MAKRKNDKAPDAGTSEAQKATRKSRHGNANKNKTQSVTARRRSDDLHYTGPQIPVPDLGPDPLDEHGAARETGILAAALSYATRGFDGHGLYVFPVDVSRNAATGKFNKKAFTKAEYSKSGQRWGATRDEATLRWAFAKWPAAGVAAPAGPENLFWVLDIDTVKGHGRDGIAELRRLEQTYGPLPPTREARSPSGGRLLFWAWPDSNIKNATNVGGCPGIDVIGNGGMVVLPPTARGDGVYEQVNDGAPIQAPGWLLNIVASKAHEHYEPNKELLAENIDELAAAVAVIPNNDLGWHQWKRFGMAIFAATAGRDEGFEIFKALSAKSKKYTDAGTIQAWHEMRGSPPNSIGTGTLYHEAYAADPDWQRRYENELMAKLRAANKRGRKQQDDDPQPQPSGGGGGADDPQPQPSDPQPPPADEVHGITIHWHGEVTPAESRRWLIQDLVPEVGTGLLSGQWGTYKTFVALDMANAVMTGAPFIDFEVMRRGGVLFIAMEGQSEIVIRLQAVIENKNKEGGRHAPFAWIETIPPLLVRGTIKQLIDITEHVAAKLKADFDLPLVMIVVDTMVAAAGYDRPGEDNDTAVQSTINNVLSSLAIATGTFVLGIDHFGKDVTVGTRGSSVKEGNADIILATLGDKNVTGSGMSNCRLVLRKRRGGINGEEIPFTPSVIDMGVDKHGKQITTVIINWHRGTQVHRTTAADWGRGKGVKLLRTVIMNMFAQEGTNGQQVRALKVDQVRGEFAKAYYADGATERAKQEAKRQAFNRALRGAIDAGAVIVRDDRLWLAQDTM